MNPTINYDNVGVPQEYTKMVSRLRGFLDDTVKQNDLEGVQESTDEELFTALEDCWDDVNYGFTPIDLTFGSIKEIPWSILRVGATLSVLESKGICSARNTLTYNDAGGITIKDQDKFGRYTVWYNTLLSEHRRRVQNWKRHANLNGAYGGIPSEYGNNAY